MKMTEAKLRAHYMKEPWARLATDMGLDPINTELQTRYALTYAAELIARLSAQLAYRAERENL